MPTDAGMRAVTAAAAGAEAPTVFICRDHVLSTLLDGLAEALQTRGVRVVRGPPNVPGEVTQFAPETHAALFSQADVAMFSSRWQCPPALLDAAPRLRAVINPTIGLETVDMAAATERGIIVGHGATPENYTSMAESSVMLMLNLLYNLRASEQVLSGHRPRPTPDHPHARMLQTATVGLIGLGRIGRAVMERLLPFGAQLLVHSPRAKLGDVPAGVTLVDLDTLLAQADIVGVFIAVTPHNRHMIDARALSLMKPDAYLVNVARGDAIDEPALVCALQQRRIAGAALDTFAVEPLPADSPLRMLDNVILTPHMVGHTREGNQSLARAALENITRVLHGDAPLHCKNPEVMARWQQRLARLPAYRLAAEPGTVTSPPR